MTQRLRTNPTELDVYVTYVARAIGLPPAQVEKDFWITELVRAVAEWSARTRVPVIWKGGTTLSKVFNLIQRFSEDVDLLVVPSGSSVRAKSETLTDLEDACAQALGVTVEHNPNGRFEDQMRATRYLYPAQHTVTGVSPSLILEAGTFGGGIPHSTRTVTSMIAENVIATGLDPDFEETQSVTIPVLGPARTLFEKLMILHSATARSEERKRKTARHYYDIWCLLSSADVRAAAAGLNAAVMAREVKIHSDKGNMSVPMRPKQGFALSPAFDAQRNQTAAKEHAGVVLTRYLWPNAPRPSFEDCCAIVHEYAAIL